MSTVTDSPPDLTVCVLLFGDHRDLAARCLNSLLTAKPEDNLNIEFRIGLNACFPATCDFVTELGVRRPELSRGAIYKSDENRFKYPMMRSMFWQPPRLLRSKYVAWFDDDSFLTVPLKQWADHVLETMNRTDAAMLGAPYTQAPQGDQQAWVEDQPWYGGKSVRTPGFKFSFMTGGYWVAKTEVLRQLNWPLVELRHRGGDVMLGEAMRQQGLTMLKDRFGVAINAGPSGVECTADKRGHDERPIGYTHARNLTRSVLASVPPVATTQPETIPPPPAPRPPEPPRPRAPKPFSLDM